MGANHVVVFLFAAFAQTPTPDSTSSPYSTPAVQHLVERAMSRRRAGDSSVADYRARIHYRLTVGLGRRHWAQVPASAVEEQVADVQWQRPNDLRVDVVGRRSRSEALELSSVWDRPWFVPRSVDDSVRIFSDEFPATGALHPLAPSAPEWYRYALTTGLSVTSGRAGTLRLLRVDVTPRRTGPALIAGRMWIDSTTAEVVRLTFRYVGTGLWVRPDGATGSDSSSARRMNALANQIISVDADLEYGLQEARYWMPHRQVISGRVRIPVVSDVVIPFRTVTTFDDFEINTGRPIGFALALPATDDPDSLRAIREVRRDSLRAARRGGAREGADSLRSWSYADRWAGGRYELHRPSNDSLGRFGGWVDSLSLDADPVEARRAREAESELARLAESLPDSLTGRRAHGVAYPRLTDAFRYDRAQGLSLGLGYRVRVPGVGFTGLYATARYGFSDDRVTGGLSLVRDAPDGRLVLSGYRDVVNVDPFAPAPGVGNSLNALFVAHDDGDYVLAHGVSAEYETSLRTGLELAVGATYARETSVARAAASEVNDFLGGSGVFPPNSPVDAGRFGGGHVRLRGAGAFRWQTTADVLGGEGTTTARAYGEVRRSLGKREGLTVRVKGGIATRPTLRQAAFRLGGIGTVRGHDYGARRGQAFWAAQVDVTPLPGRLRPALFVDAGQAGSAGTLFSGRVLAGAGVGLSVFGGLLRLDLSRPVSPDDATLRFDIVVQGAR